MRAEILHTRVASKFSKRVSSWVPIELKSTFKPSDYLGRQPYCPAHRGRSSVGTRAPTSKDSTKRRRVEQKSCLTNPRLPPQRPPPAASATKSSRKTPISRQSTSPRFAMSACKTPSSPSSSPPFRTSVTIPLGGPPEWSCAQKTTQACCLSSSSRNGKSG